MVVKGFIPAIQLCQIFLLLLYVTTSNAGFIDPIGAMKATMVNPFKKMNMFTGSRNICGRPGKGGEKCTPFGKFNKLEMAMTTLFMNCCRLCPQQFTDKLALLELPKPVQNTIQSRFDHVIYLRNQNRKKSANGRRTSSSASASSSTISQNDARKQTPKMNLNSFIETKAKERQRGGLKTNSKSKITSKATFIYADGDEMTESLPCCNVCPEQFYTPMDYDDITDPLATDSDDDPARSMFVEFNSRTSETSETNRIEEENSATSKKITVENEDNGESEKNIANNAPSTTDSLIHRQNRFRKQFEGMKKASKGGVDSGMGSSNGGMGSSKGGMGSSKSGMGSSGDNRQMAPGMSVNGKMLTTGYDVHACCTICPEERFPNRYISATFKGTDKAEAAAFIEIMVKKNKRESNSKGFMSSMAGGVGMQSPMGMASSTGVRNAEDRPRPSCCPMCPDLTRVVHGAMEPFGGVFGNGNLGGQMSEQMKLDHSLDRSDMDPRLDPQGTDAAMMGGAGALAGAAGGLFRL
jgi:hypothetical protein